MEILSRARKTTGKYKHAYNVREYADDGEESMGWVDLKDYDVVKEMKKKLGVDENEKRDTPVEEEEGRRMEISRRGT